MGYQLMEVLILGRSHGVQAIVINDQQAHLDQPGELAVLLTRDPGFVQVAQQ